MRHREGTELHLEPDQPGDGRLDHRRHRPRSLIGRRRLSDTTQHTEQEGAGSCRRIRDGHLRNARIGGREARATVLADHDHHADNREHHRVPNRHRAPDGWVAGDGGRGGPGSAP